MDTIVIERTTRSPDIRFDFAANTFSMAGESYPEDVSAFYGPLLQKLEAHLEALDSAAVRFRLELIYFNSSTAKVLMELFEILDEAGRRGNTVSVVWAYEQDDDNLKELGEEFGAELSHASFEMEELSV